MYKPLNSKNVCKSLLVSMILIGLAVLSLGACGGGSNGNVSSHPTPTPTSVSTLPPTPKPTAIPSPPPKPTATQTPVPIFASFKVISIDMAMSPRNMAALICGTTLTVVYTAIFHIAPYSPGGIIQFTSTWNNGRGQSNASIHVDAGQTTATYAYTWSGRLLGDGVLPGIGAVWTSSPNVVYSSQVLPVGVCKVAAFKVTSISMAVSPKSLTGLPCGSPPTLTYTATFHIAPYSPGGTIQFSYTGNNGRSSPPASIHVGAGQTTATYSYTWLVYVFGDRLVAGVASVVTSSPNVVYSPQLILPQVTCTAPTAAFKVTSIDMTVSPISVAGLPCGTSLTATYTATFHIAPNSPGGTIQFWYTWDRRAESRASITVGAGQTTATYSYTWSGQLSEDHVYPGIGEVWIDSPNIVYSSQARPAGGCV